MKVIRSLAAVLALALFAAFPAAVSAQTLTAYTGLPLTGSCGTVVVSTPCLSLTQTWNNAAITFTGLKLNITDTASAGGSLLLDLQMGGVSKFNVRKDGAVITTGTLFVGNSVAITNNGGQYLLGSASDVALARDAANTLALRNGVNAQTFRAYNTYTDASNGEWAELAWSSNVVYLRPNKNGTGAARILVPVTGATTVAALPACNAALEGAHAGVTDATATTFLSAVAGAGANHVPVYCDGTSWKIG